MPARQQLVTEEWLTNLDGVIDEASMDDIAFLTVEQVIRLHEEITRQFSPTETLYVRDQGLLESAVMVPQQTFEGAYLYKNLVEMASAYLIGLAQNHAFENGNKRVAFAACSEFLRMNGYMLRLTEDEAVDLTLRVIAHALDREDVVMILGHAIEEL
jgi:death-on-curing protein